MDLHVIFYGPFSQVIRNERLDSSESSTLLRRTFDGIPVMSVRIEEKACPCLSLKQFELLSPDGEYSGGIFATLFKVDPNNLPKYFEISARNYDGSKFHCLKDTSLVWTRGQSEHEGVEVQFPHGAVIPMKYRLRTSRLSHWSIRCSKNRDLPLDQWTIVHGQEQESPPKGVVEFECAPSITPYKFLRIVAESRSPKGLRGIKLDYFDIDGQYIPDE